MNANFQVNNLFLREQTFKRVHVELKPFLFKATVCRMVLLKMSHLKLYNKVFLQVLSCPDDHVIINHTRHYVDVLLLSSS